MAPTLRAHGVRTIALSRDDISQAGRMHREEGLESVTLLADPELEVIAAFGLVHHKALVVGSPILRVFGLPLGIPKGFEAMAIPTTLLVDEAGVVRWIDQADDYRIRSDSARVEAALRDAFATGISPEPRA